MVIVLSKPNFPPYVCLVCGVGSAEARKWYADLQLPIDNYFNPVNDGATYVCNECWDGITKNVAQQAQILLLGQEPWEGEPATFEDDNELQFGVITKEDNGPGIPDQSSTGFDLSPTDDSGPTEPDDPPIDPSVPDDEPDSVSDFRGFFGKHG